MGYQECEGVEAFGLEGGFKDVQVSAYCFTQEALMRLIRLRFRGLEHSATPEEIDDVEKFLKETIPAIGDKTSL